MSVHFSDVKNSEVHAVHGRLKYAVASAFAGGGGTSCVYQAKIRFVINNKLALSQFKGL